MNELQRILRGKGIVTHPIQEFRGSEDFYSLRKFTPEVNFVRSLNFMQEFVDVAKNERTQVILVDRGLYDTKCWLNWFSLRQSVPEEYFIVNEQLLNLVPKFADRYRLVWMDRNPIDACNSHGKPGRIVTYENLVSLRKIYEIQMEALPSSVTPCAVMSDTETIQSIANKLIGSLKLIRSR